MAYDSMSQLWLCCPGRGGGDATAANQQRILDAIAALGVEVTDNGTAIDELTASVDGALITTDGPTFCAT